MTNAISARKNKMCWDKKLFKTENDAISACISASRKFGRMRWYKCPYGDHWHMTHQCEEVG